MSTRSFAYVGTSPSSNCLEPVSWVATLSYNSSGLLAPTSEFVTRVSVAQSSCTN